MKIVRKLRKTKMALIYSLFGSIACISFIILLLSNHLYNIKMNKILKDLNSHSNYSLVFKEAKTCQNKKYLLFSLNGYDFSGYCIQEVYLSYNGLNFPLKKVLEKGYLKVEDIYKNTTEMQKDNFTTKVQNEKENYSIITSHLYEKYTEVIFSKES